MSAAKRVKDLHCTQTYRNYAVLQQLYMSWRKSRKEGKKQIHDFVPGKAEAGESRPWNDTQHHAGMDGSWGRRGCHLGWTWRQIKKIIPSWKASALTPSSGPMDHHLQNPPQTTLLPEQCFFCGANEKLSLKQLLPASSKYRKYNYIGCGFLTSKTIRQIFKAVTMCKANLKKIVNFSSGESTSNPK